MGDGQREWVEYLIREERLPAELQGGGGSHEQARLLSHQEAAIRGTELGQLPFVHTYDTELIKADPVTETPTSYPRREEPGTPASFHTCLVRKHKEISHSLRAALAIQS